MQLKTRSVEPRAAWALEQSGQHPLLARLFAARGVASAHELDDALTALLPPDSLLGTSEAAQLLTAALQNNLHLCVVADYDCDGATACAVALRGLRAVAVALGSQAKVSFIVPDRVVDGYGLTPPIAQRVKAAGADVLITVDNGIASLEGVATAKALGLQVLITDHHLPAAPINGQVPLPAADVVVNPNQPACGFVSKSMAGVGVMFYVLLALRAHLRREGLLDAATQPKLDTLLPLVALGTVADVVKLDANNRRLVAQGLARIRKNAAPPGLLALLAVAGRRFDAVTAADFGFALGPRINAAGRLADMTLGIEALTTDDPTRAAELAQMLDGINRERRSIEQGMQHEAEAQINAALAHVQDLDAVNALCVFDEGFHEGVVGIVASRLKDKANRPTFVFAPSNEAGMLKGSGRSIEGFHLRDALDWVSKKYPHCLVRFGGHAMAAGCTVRREHFDAFATALAEIAALWLTQEQKTKSLATDGALEPEYTRLDVAHLLAQPLWGQGFAAPVFQGWFDVVSQRSIGAQQNHLALKLRRMAAASPSQDAAAQANKSSRATKAYNAQPDQPLEAVFFNRSVPLPSPCLLAYRLEADAWQGQEKLKLMVVAAENT